MGKPSSPNKYLVWSFASTGFQCKPCCGTKPDCKWTSRIHRRREIPDTSKTVHDGKEPKPEGQFEVLAMAAPRKGIIAVIREKVRNDILAANGLIKQMRRDGIGVGRLLSYKDVAKPGGR